MSNNFHNYNVSSYDASNPTVYAIDTYYYVCICDEINRSMTITLSQGSTHTGRVWSGPTTPNCRTTTTNCRTTTTSFLGAVHLLVCNARPIYSMCSYA